MLFCFRQGPKATPNLSSLNRPKTALKSIAYKKGDASRQIVGIYAKINSPKSLYNFNSLENLNKK